MIQKFRKLSFVRVGKMPQHMAHFDGEIDAIVDGTFTQIHGGRGQEGRSLRQYCLFLVRDGVIYNHVSWYEEDQLTLLTVQDSLLAEQMIETYQTRP